MPSLPSLPSVPGVDTLVDLTRSQVQIMQQIPGILVALNQTLTKLADALQQSSETMQAVQRVSQRMDHVMDEIEEPVMMMGPGLRRLAVMLDDPMITAVPDMIRTVREDVGPQMREIIAMQHNIQQSAVQVVGGLSDATKALGSVPGLGKLPGLLGPRPTRHPADDVEEAPAVEAPDPAPPPPTSARRSRTSTSKSTSSRSSSTRSRTSSPGEDEEPAASE